MNGAEKRYEDLLDQIRDVEGGEFDACHLIIHVASRVAEMEAKDSLSAFERYQNIKKILKEAKKGDVDSDALSNEMNLLKDQLEAMQYAETNKSR